MRHHESALPKPSLIFLPELRLILPTAERPTRLAVCLRAQVRINMRTLMSAKRQPQASLHEGDVFTAYPFILRTPSS